MNESKVCEYEREHRRRKIERTLVLPALHLDLKDMEDVVSVCVCALYRCTV